MKTYEEVLDATENAMLARRLQYGTVPPISRAESNRMVENIARLFPSPHRFSEPQHR